MALPVMPQIDSLKAFVDKIPYVLTVQLSLRQSDDTFAEGVNFKAQKWAKKTEDMIVQNSIMWSLYASDSQVIRPRVGDRVVYGGLNYQVLAVKTSFGDAMCECECVLES
jgi:hypothetical protein